LFGTRLLQLFKHSAALSFAVFTHKACCEAIGELQADVSLYFVKTQSDVHCASCAAAIGTNQDISRLTAKNVLASRRI
jgi:hypothetical protein